jgi:hypothetical protein
LVRWKITPKTFVENLEIGLLRSGDWNHSRAGAPSPWHGVPRWVSARGSRPRSVGATRTRAPRGHALYSIR